MSPKSPVFLEVDGYEKEPNVRRASSNGHLDFLQSQEIWARRDAGLQMTPYHHRGYYGASQKRTGADSLAVPTFEVSPRRQRASSDGRLPYNTNQLSREFQTMEVRPQEPVSGVAEPANKDVRHMRGSTHSKTPAYQRPKAPPVLVQERPPALMTTHQDAGERPNASARSTSEFPQLQYKYWLLQDRLSDISSACARYAEVEAARPGDLTFAKVSKQAKGFAFDLQVWSHVSNIQSVPRIDVPDDAVAVADAASRIMDRLTDRAAELSEACSKAKPNDLRFEDVETDVDEDTMFDGTHNDCIEQDATESLGYIIESGLHSISLQIKSLKRLTRCLQEATPDAKEEVKAVTSLVAETGRYFGSSDALKRFPVDAKFAGRRALEEARFVAAR